MGGSYVRKVPQDKHLADNIVTQRIERNNLTLRTRIKRLTRKTICFSRSIELHEKVIGAFIEKQIFYSLDALPKKSPNTVPPSRYYYFPQLTNDMISYQ